MAQLSEVDAKPSEKQDARSVHSMNDSSAENDKLLNDRRPASSNLVDEAYDPKAWAQLSNSEKSRSSNDSDKLFELKCIPKIGWVDEATDFFEKSLYPVLQPKSDEAKKWLHEIDGLDDKGILWNGHDGEITKEGMTEFIDQVKADKEASSEKVEYAAKLQDIVDKWDTDYGSYLHQDDSLNEMNSIGQHSIGMAEFQTKLNRAFNLCEPMGN